MIKLIAPQIVPKTIKALWANFLRFEISSSCILLYIYTGRINAKAVQANEPIRLINRPNLGTNRAPVAVNNTVNVLKNIRFVG